MIDNTGMYQGYSVEGDMKKESFVSNNSCGPIYECPIEKCVHKEIVHVVPHICPIKTRVINHHIYKHTYSPCYSCTEENEICNVDEGCCNKFI